MLNVQEISALLTKLEWDIINLPCIPTMVSHQNDNLQMSYKEGHRDARHAAAELVTALGAELERLAEAPYAALQDYDLTPEQLDDKYNPDGGGEHPEITREDWAQAVEQGETSSGYWGWLSHKLIEKHEDEDDAAD
jgi:hypothetical protein